MPDPVWTEVYNMGNTPEQNGFTRTLQGSPTITENSGGNPANRNVEINSDNGDAVFLTSVVPSLSMPPGATLEAEGSVSGSGDGGFELTFLDCAILVNVFENFVNYSMPSGFSEPNRGGVTVPGIEADVATDSNNTRIVWRVTIDGSRNWNIYRDEILVAGPIPAHFLIKPFQRILWWGEGGGIQTFYTMKYYIGGAVAPG